MSSPSHIARAVRRTLMLSAVATAASISAVAQEQAKEAAAAAPPGTAPEEVVITGSRISEPGLTTVSPVTSVTPADIQQQGGSRIEDMLNTLPQIFGDQGSALTNGESGTATVNLRGLGTQRTLVLVNGRRLLPGDPSSVNGQAADLNNIPAALVQRIDVLTGGASSVYGADAVAGVVNFVMNDHFEGVKLDLNAAGYQHSQHNPDSVQQGIAASGFQQAPSDVLDGASKDVTLIMGKNLADGSGNFTAYFGYRKINPILQSARDFAACEPDTTTNPPTCLGSSTASPARIIPIAYSPTGALGSGVAPNGAGGGFTFKPDGQLIPFGDQNLYNFNPTQYFQRPDERWTAGSFLHINVTDKVTLYNEFQFMHDDSVGQIAAGGAFLGSGTATDFNTGVGNGTLQIHCSNPFLTSAELGQLCNGSTQGFSQLFLGKRNVEGGARIGDIDHQSYREVLGLKGEIVDGWTFDAYAQEGYTSAKTFATGDFSKNALANAIDAVTGPNGTPVCASGAAGCVPYNPFQPGGVTQASLNYMQTPSIVDGNTEERVIDANVTGDLGKYGLKSPGADDGLILNFGGQYRSEHATIRPDFENITNDLSGAGGPVFPLDAGFKVYEGYLEAGLPILQNKAFAKELSVETGYRFSSYDLGFNTNTYKFGVTWAPNSDVRFRASYQRAVRAPNLEELFAEKGLILEGSFDPCAGSTTGMPSASMAQCLRGNPGLSPTATGIAAYGGLIPNAAAQYQGLAGGNPQLKPEQSDTYSLGVVLTPSAVPNLSVQVDYFDIKINNVISSYGFALSLNECYDAAQGSAVFNYFCNNIHRDSSGTLWASQNGYVIDPTLNLGGLETRGADFTANYHLDLERLGKLSFSLYGTYTADLITTLSSLLGSASYNCAGYYGATCSTAQNGGPVPKWKHKLRVAYDTPLQGLEVALQWRYIGAVEQDVFSPNPLLTGTNPGGPQFVPSYSYIDMSVAYAFNPNVTVRVGVDNLADKDPPLLSGAFFPPPFNNGNTYPEVYDSLGRFLYANLTLQF